MAKKISNGFNLQKQGSSIISNVLSLVMTYVLVIRMCDALRDLVPFVQFKRREKHPWRSVNFSKVAG